jgi:ribosome-associated toxin RatA of RatAB toxin-antitoxin module
VHLLLEVHQEEGLIQFRDRCGRSFSRYEGSWRLTATNGRTTIAYELTAKPSFDVPDFVLGRLLKRDAKKMIEGLRQEMARRGKTSAKRA